ncbi:AsmA-like C-terminal region-containing protein [Marinobacter sp. CHS3-4]|uniref:YhdP family phospholipid transporter n=1 Tax=Marinobacter sp. CHS3-4 TaxID=3045174 RepID=UPI0024B4FCB1|nr:AsmA-like C-terminal region-containing protein [Marinobacter sp. CHS3-4]MDI9244920.1 AsmA-like C-terminal region-containing protein [Marinobacter sp. CHS3-4]
MSAAEAGKRSRGLLLQLLARLANLIWWLLLGTLVLAALYAGLGRQLTQNINDYRPEIEQQLSDRLGHQVQIGSLSSRWRWLNPTIIARDLALKPGDGSDEVIGSLQSLRVGLDFLASLSRFRIVFSDFDANGLELVINQTPRGEIGVEGADLPEPVANDLEKWIDLAGQWLSDPYVQITRIDLGLRDSLGQLRQVEIPQLDLIYRRGLFHASGRAMRPGTTEQLASFELVGQHFFRGDFTGQFYGDINSGRLFDGLIQEYSWKGMRAEGFDIGGQIWLTFRNGLMEQASGNLQTPYLQIGVHQESLAPLEDISARFGWRRYQPEDAYAADIEAEDQAPWYATGEFHLNDLTWSWNGEVMPEFDLRFQTRKNDDLLIADGFPVGPVTGLFSRLSILPTALTSALENYRPSGTLNRLLLELPTEDPGQFRFTANLEDINVKAHGGAPEVEGLDGSIIVTSQGGLVKANSNALTFGFPSLFKGLWDVRQFNANVAWQIEEGTTRVFSDDIAMSYGDSTGLTGAFDLKLVPGGSDVLSLQVGVKDGNAPMLAEFVPVHLVDSALYDWLNTAITKADITRGTYYGHGTISSGAPPGSFVSSMFYDFSNTTINYDDRWPEVSGAAGRVFIHQGQTRVDLASGETGGIELTPGQVRVKPTSEQTMLYVDAGGPINGDALAYWLSQSPLRDLTDLTPDSLLLQGELGLDLGLGFALGSDQPPMIDATVSADSVSLFYPAVNLNWENVSGVLSYNTQAGFSSEPVTGLFLGSPVKTWFRRAESGDGLVIRQAGDVAVEDVRRKLGMSDQLALGIEGKLGYEAALSLLPDQPARVRLTSDLTGVSIGWPEPLGKVSDAAAPVDVSVVPDPDNGFELSIDWQDRMNADVDWQTGRVNIALNNLTLGNRSFDKLGIEAVEGMDNWLVDLEGGWVKGLVTWPVGDGSIQVDLEALALEQDKDPGGEGKELDDRMSVQDFRDLESGRWPDVDVRIADLKLNDEDAGIWSFGLRPEAERFRVANIKGQLKSLVLQGDLDWGIRGDEVRTGFAGTLNGKSLADASALFAAEVPFRNEKTAIELDLDWPGRPDQFETAALSGTASMRFDQGVILEGNNTAQLFRIFNLLNSDTLWRRLKLDFSDLYEAGVAFDAISGKARLEDGVLTLDPELQIVGPSGAFKFSGATDLAEETLDMNMVVVLPLTQNLPLAALLMGAGAPIGGALFVLDKVLGDPLSKLTSATYSVKGTWANPDVDLKRVFDSGS